VTTFLHKSFTDLDIITKNQIAQKGDIYIHPSFKPLTLNVKKAIEIVNKFEMIPPSGAAVAKSMGPAGGGATRNNPHADGTRTAQPDVRLRSNGPMARTGSADRAMQDYGR
jgi:hypothetical protein